MKKYIILYCVAILQTFNLCGQIKPFVVKQPPVKAVQPLLRNFDRQVPVKPTTIPRPVPKSPVKKAPIIKPFTPPVTSAPATPVIQPFTAVTPDSSLLAKPAESAPVQDPSQQKFTEITGSPNPAFSEDANNRLTQYKQLLLSLNSQTPDTFFKQVTDSFIDTIINQALQSNAITLKNIIDTEEATENCVSALAQLSARLRMQPKTDKKRKAISAELKRLKRKGSELAKRVDMLKKFAKRLIEIKKMSNKNLMKKLKEYDATLKKLSTPLTTDITTTLIKDLEEVGNIAKSRGGAELEELKKVTSFVQTHPFFNVQQKQQLTQVTYEKPIKVAPKIEISQAAPNVQLQPIIKAKIQELKAKQQLVEKIIGIRSLLALIDAGSNQAEKNELTNFLNELFLQQSKMTRQELMLLKESFEDAVLHKFFLAYNQRPIMEQWIKSLSFAIELSDQQSPLITALKNNIKQDKEDYMKAIQSAFFALNLLDTTIDPAEKDKKNKESLLSILRKKLTSFYSKRGKKTIEELDNLKNLFNAIKTNQSFAGMIVPSWEESLNISIALATAEAQTSTLSKINSYRDIAKMLKADTDAYEKGLFVDGLTNIFANRKQRAVKELQKFKDILKSLSNDQARQQKIFDSADYDRFTTWDKILDGTIILLGSIKQLKLDEQIKKLDEALDLIINPQAQYEKDIFIPHLSHIFTKRGQFNNQELNQTKIFFEKIKNTRNFLATNQMSVLVLWLQEIDEAIIITSRNKKTYDQALLEQAVGLKDLDQIEKAVNLFTEKTTADTKNILVKGLNDLFTTRRTPDLLELKDLFDLVNKKEVGGKPLLNDQQRDVIDQWITILDGEIKKQ